MKKLISFYWGGGSLSYLQHLSIVSFNRHNPDWKINLFMPDTVEVVAPTWNTGEQSIPYTGRDYLEQAKKLCTVIKVDFEKQVQGKLSHEVQKSDVIRWQILYEQGGVWSDIDILYTRPIDLIVGDVALVYHQNPYIGLLVAKPNQQIFKELWHMAKDRVRRNYDSNYQSLGGHLLRDRFQNFENIQRAYPSVDFTNLEMDVVYPYLPSDIEEMLFGEKDKTTSNTIGVHWYNGSPLAKEYQNNFEKHSRNKSIISKLVKDYV